MKLSIFLLALLFSYLISFFIHLKIIELTREMSMYYSLVFAVFQNIMLFTSLFLCGYKFSFRTVLWIFLLSLFFAYAFIFNGHRILHFMYPYLHGLSYLVYIVLLRLFFSLRISNWVFINCLIVFGSIVASFYDPTFKLTTYIFLLAHGSGWLFIKLPKTKDKTYIKFDSVDFETNLRKMFFD